MRRIQSGLPNRQATGGYRETIRAPSNQRASSAPVRTVWALRPRVAPRRAEGDRKGYKSSTAASAARFHASYSAPWTGHQRRFRRGDRGLPIVDVKVWTIFAARTTRRFERNGLHRSGLDWEITGSCQAGPIRTFQQKKASGTVTARTPECAAAARGSSKAGTVDRRCGSGKSRSVEAIIWFPSSCGTP